MEDLSKYDIPWDVISASLQRDLTVEEGVQLQQWLSESEANKEKYDQLSRIWNEGITDFPIYQLGNETKTWEAFQQKLTLLLPEEKQSRVIKGTFISQPGMKKWITIAAVLILVISVTLWYSGNENKEWMYQTLANEQKNITLPDGSAILLKQQSQIRVAAAYNKPDRTVTLIKGGAFFTVIHKTEQPFIVNAGPSSIRDIGTSFTIQKTENAITVVVATGKVIFMRKDTRESRELTEGMGLSYDILSHRFDSISSQQSLSIKDSTASLHFDNIPLSDVLNMVEKVHKRKIEWTNDAIRQKKLTADLRGQPFDKALQVICISSNLEFTESNGVYLLKEKMKH